MNFTLLKHPPRPVRWLLSSLWLVLLPLLGWGQTTTIFNETFGTPSGTTSITSYAAGSGQTTFSTKGNGYTYSSGGASNSSDIRATSPSNYAGASGSGNTFFANSSAEYGFAINGINTSGYTNLTLSFGLRKESAAAYTFVLDYSTDGGVNYSPITVSTLPNSAASAAWYNITGVSLPVAAQVPSLSLRFRKTSTTTGLRIDDIILTGTAAPSNSPTVTATPTATFIAFSTPVGTPSTAQTYNLSGSNLTDDVTATAPAGYEVAQSVSTTTTTPGTYATTQTIAQNNGSVSATIYVRLTGATAGTYSGNVTNVSGTAAGAPSASVAVTGGVPDLTTSTNSLTAFNTSQGTASAYQTYTLSGTGLTTTSVTVKAPVGYQIAQSAATTTTTPGTYATTQTITPSSGSVSATIYVRLTGTTAGTYSGDVTNEASNATTRNVTVSGTVTPPAPALAVTATTLTNFTYVAGNGPSASQNFGLSGSNLTGAPGTITVTGSTNYEVSADNTTFGSTATVAYSGASLASTRVYVRLKAGLSAGNYNGEIISIAGGGAASATTVTMSGSVSAPTPVITVAPTTALSFATTTGTPSAEQSYTVSAANLTAPLTVTAPTGYEVSLTSGTYTGTGGNVVTLTPTSGTVASTSIYVRLTGAASGTPSGNITNASSGATTRNIAVSGTVTTPVLPALATYSLLNVTGKAVSAPATSKDTNITTADPLTRGAGLSTIVGTISTSSNLFGSSSWSLSNLADAQANDKYVSFAITPTLGYIANISSIVGNVYRTSTGPTTVQLFYSFTSDFFNPQSLGEQSTITGLAGGGAAISFPANAAALQNVTTPIYFRLYGYGATNNTGILYFTNNTSTNNSAPGLVVNGTTVLSPQPVIAIGTATPTAVCGGSTITATYFTGNLTPTGTYFVQLSDATGSFANPLDLSPTSSTNGSVTATIPATVASGTGYRVRVANTDGTRSSISTALTVVSNPIATVVPTASQTINAGTAGTTLTVTETPIGVSRQWFYGTTAGGPYTTAISGATGLTYTPNFATAGTYYVVAQSTFAACGPVTSNEVAVTVTLPSLVAAPTALTGLTTNVGAASVAQSYVLTGAGVLAPVTVSAPAGAEVSLDGITFIASVSAPAANVNAGQTIYVRLLGSATGSVSGNITNTVGAVTVSVALSGNVLVQPGVLLVEDDFDYFGNLSANGWSGTAVSTTLAGNITVPTYPQGVLAIGGASYQARILGNSGNDLTRFATVPSGTTALYAAALINVSTVSNVSGDDYLFSFQTTGGTTSYRGRVTFVRGSAATKFTLRLRAGNTNPVTIGTEFNTNTDYVLVLKAENSPATGNADRFSLYVLPSGTNLSQEPSSPLLTVDGVNVFSTIGGFNIRQSESNNPILSMDNFRFATGWGAAVGNVTYSSPSASINAGSYYNVTANNGQATQTGAVTVENRLALSDGRLNLNGQQLTLAGSGINSGNGSLTGSTTSDLVLLGNGALGTLAFTPGSQTINNLTINRTGMATLGTPLAVNGTLALTNGMLATTTTSPLSLTSAATISGGSATSFISGPLRRTIGGVSAATSVNFPIGKGTAYRPLMLNIGSQSGSTIYQAEQLEQSGGTNVDATLQRVSQVRYFSVTPYSVASPTVVEQPAGFSGTLTLAFGADDQVTDPTATSFVVGKRDNSAAAWTSIGGTGTGSASGGTLTSGSFTSFSDFALASTDTDLLVNPLPVKLTSFSAARAASGVQVAWATASEKNSDYFVVERSLDGHAFVAVAKVAAHGTTTQSHTYASFDGTAPAALLYYRLRQVDLDGTVAYSPVVTVAATDGATAEFTLAPNPARERVSFVTTQPTAYIVRNTLGQLVRSGTTIAGTNDLLVNELPAGVYFFELQSGTGRVVRKFVKE